MIEISNQERVLLNLINNKRTLMKNFEKRKKRPLQSGVPAKQIVYHDGKKMVGNSEASESMPKKVIKGGS